MPGINIKDFIETQRYPYNNAMSGLMEKLFNVSISVLINNTTNPQIYFQKEPAKPQLEPQDLYLLCRINPSG